jgi:SAM-dependent methyltransferase
VRFNDADLVRREYASEERLLARRVVFKDFVEGPNAEDLAFEAVREAKPGRVLEVGCGPGYFAERVQKELGAEVVALDVSPRMVELTREHGVDARIGDVQDLPFGDAEFDCAVANWMLYHVPDLDRGIAELARVLRPGGRLVAATFGEDHLRELWSLLGNDKASAVEFNRQNGASPLGRHFQQVERRDADGVVAFPDRAAVRSYVTATIRGAHLADSLPEFDGPFRARSRASAFVAAKAGGGPVRGWVAGKS